METLPTPTQASLETATEISRSAMRSLLTCNKTVPAKVRFETSPSSSHGSKWSLQANATSDDEILRSVPLTDEALLAALNDEGSSSSSEALSVVSSVFSAPEPGSPSPSP